MKPPVNKDGISVEPELSCPLSVARIPPAGLVQEILATPDQRTALVDRLGLLGLSRLEAHLEVHLASGDFVEVRGWLKADVVQQCVVTLEPLPLRTEVKVDALFAPASYETGGEGMADLSLYEDRDVDYIQNGVIDLGELVTQNLAVALDPYPRKEGISPVGDPASVIEKRPNPFIALQGKRKD